jgi:hypothetical protein
VAGLCLSFPALPAWRRVRGSGLGRQPVGGLDRLWRDDLEFGDEVFESSAVVEPRLVAGELLVGEELGDGLAPDGAGPLGVGPCRAGGSALQAQLRLPQRISRTTTDPGSSPSISARALRVAAKGGPCAGWPYRPPLTKEFNKSDTTEQTLPRNSSETSPPNSSSSPTRCSSATYGPGLSCPLATAAS